MPRGPGGSEVVCDPIIPVFNGHSGCYVENGQVVRWMQERK